MTKDYSALIAETSRISAIEGLAVHAPLLVDLAERDICDRLRSRDMEARRTLTTDAQGRAELPDDFLDLRFVMHDDRKMRQGSAAHIRPGTGNGFAIEGGTLYSSHAETAHMLGYWARPPSLAEADTGENALLRAEPGLFLHACLFQAHALFGDAEKAAGYRLLIDRHIAMRNGDARAAQLVSARIDPGDVP